MPRILLALTLLVLCTREASAQRVRVLGDVGHPAAALLEEIVERGRFQLLDRDTVLPASTRISGDLLVVNATVRLEGTVEGAAAVVGGALFVRPGARAIGPLAALGGELFVSHRASAGDTLQLPQEIAVTVSRAEGDFTIRLTAPRPPAPLAPSGLFGLGLPTYDRVNGATIPLGVTLRLGEGTGAPKLSGTARYHVARGTLGGSLALDAPLSRDVQLVVDGGRATFTNEQWIRGDLPNSAAALLVRSDARDYYESDYLSLLFARRGTVAPQTGQTVLSPRLELRASRDRSLRARNVWSALGGSEPWRSNPAVREGVLTSVIAGTRAAWKGSTTGFRGDLAVEWGALSDEAFGEREDDFAQVVTGGLWNMRALASHSASVRFRLMQPLTDAAAPPQRHSSIGGPGTLPTLDYDARRGDHLVFVESEYLVPLSVVTIPVLGPPSLALVHAIGSARVTGEASPRWEQNLGAGFRFAFASAILYLDPAADRFRPTFSLSLSLP